MLKVKRHILIAAALLAAFACDKTPEPWYTLTDAPIMLSATDAGTTKALLEETTFATENNQIQIYDYYTSTTGTGIYISDQIKADGSGTDVWPFVNKRYNWTSDGQHQFFGWFHTDANSNMTAADLFGETFTPVIFDAQVTTTVPAFNTENQVLTIPETVMSQNSPQFDFMYSNVHVRDLDAASPDYVSPVPLDFRHLFTAFCVTAQSLQTSNEITIESIAIEGLCNKNSATVSYKNVGDEEDPVVNYGTGANDNPAVPDFTFTPSAKLGTGVTDMSTPKTAEKDYFLMWPMDAEEVAEVALTVKYRLNDEEELISRTINLSAKAWEAGKKNNVNLLFKDKEIVLQCIVMDWIPNEETIDFSDQVSVKARMEWSNVTSNSNGEVILYNDTNIEAVCDFHIETPRGATWTASLIPVEGHLDAFEFVDGTANGAVGVDSQLRLTVTNQAPIAPRHICILRITVQTADGRTIVVKNLVPGKEDAEFRIIQNLING